MTNASSQDAVAKHVADLLALEEQLLRSVTAQSRGRSHHTGLIEVLNHLQLVCEQHIESLKVLTRWRNYTGQTLTARVKRATASALGLGVAARGETISRDLEENCLVLSRACIGYLMLLTTGRSLGDREVAELAQLHLERHARCVMTLQNLIPIAVVRQFIEAGLPARTDALSGVGESIQRAWSAHAVAPASTPQYGAQVV